MVSRKKIGMIILCFILLCIKITILMKLLWKAKNMIDKKDGDIGRLTDYYWLFEHWINQKNNGMKIEDFFKENNFREIAVYGMGEPGHLLCNELKGSTVVEVKYGLDKNFTLKKAIVEVRSLSDNIIPVDAIVVTPISHFHEIRQELKEKYECPIISLEDGIYSS